MDRFASFRSLAGKTIKHAIIMNQHGSGSLPVIILEDGSHVEFWRDAEGNGPGHAEVVPPLPKQRAAR